MKTIKLPTSHFPLPDSKGQMIVIVMIILTLAMVILLPLVRLVKQESVWTVGERKKSIAFHLAEAATDRGYWKIKSSTATCVSAVSGTVIPGYDFDTTYSDISGGTYRVRFSSGPGRSEVTIIGEGRDVAAKETRTIRTVVKNQTIYSPLIVSGSVSLSQFFELFWGPMMSQGNIGMTDAVVAMRYFPRKFSKGVVTGQGIFTRDTNGLDPPNTDNVEWWSDYKYTPDLPLLDFDALRSSAIATGTYNRYDTGSTIYYPNQPIDDSGPELVWYWDGDVTFSHDPIWPGGAWWVLTPTTNYGFKGTVIVRRNLTIKAPGLYKFTGPVPSDAWKDHNKLLRNTFDTAATGEYPADTGLNQNKLTFNFGTETFRDYPAPGGSSGFVNTVGVRGFTYVGGNLTINAPWGFTDFIGAVWVVGNVIVSGGGSGFCTVFYNDNLQVPLLNVILTRQSWQETSPNSQAWVAP